MSMEEVEVQTTALATAEPAKTSLTPNEEKEATQRWAEKLSYFKDREKITLRDVLMIHWEKGEFIAELQRAPRQYGNRTVPTFAEEMGVSNETAYLYLRFHERYTKEQLQESVTRGIAWRNITYLLSVEDVQKRTTLEQRLCDKAITPEQLKDQVKKINKVTKKAKKASGEKVSNQGGTPIKTTFRSTVSLSIDFVKKLDECKEAIKTYYKLPDGAQRSGLLPGLREVIKALMEVQKRAAIVVETKDKLSEKESDK